MLQHCNDKDVTHAVLFMHQQSCINLIKFNDSITKCIMYDANYKTCDKNCNKSCEAEQTTVLIAVHVMFGSMQRGLHF